MAQLTLQPSFVPPKTEIYFGLDPLAELSQQTAKRGVIFADVAIAESHGALIQKITGYELIAIKGEKTREAKQALEDELFKRKIGRDTLFIALGGGTVTDLIGFLASTYMRGVPLILIPTTLLGMVDAAIGGKTAVDTPFGKNLIGSFYLPKAILIDLRMLHTLPEKEMKNGLSEILKYGLIQNREIWEKCVHWRKELLFLIRESIHCKIKIVAEDFEEKKGLRRVLNFGHTVGHSLELISEYKMTHGEAVALGCMAESYLSHSLGYLSQEEWQKILHCYQSLGYRFPKIDQKAFLEALSMDKKGKGEEPRFVLIEKIGQALSFQGEYCRTVPRKELEEMLHALPKM
jgi:3-dehydroquinate synthase